MTMYYLVQYYAAMYYTIRPYYFAFGNRYLSVLHIRIRNNCSNLINILFISHLSDNLLCNWCNEIEDGKHYFLYCNNYSNERCVLFEITRDVQPLLTNVLLYGNDTLDSTLNSSLFRTVHDYIKSAKRFDNTWSYFLYLIRKFKHFNSFYAIPNFLWPVELACSL